MAACLPPLLACLPVCLAVVKVLSTRRAPPSLSLALCETAQAETVAIIRASIGGRLGASLSAWIRQKMSSLNATLLGVYDVPDSRQQ